MDLLASGVIHLAAWGLNLSAPASKLGLLDDSLAGASFVSRASAALPTFWRGVIGLIARGWIYAYFWTTAAFLYLLLRQDVDGTPPTAVNPVTAPSSLPAYPRKGILVHEPGSECNRARIAVRTGGNIGESCRLRTIGSRGWSGMPAVERCQKVRFHLQVEAGSRSFLSVAAQRDA